MNSTSLFVETEKQGSAEGAPANLLFTFQFLHYLRDGWLGRDGHVPNIQSIKVRFRAGTECRTYNLSTGLGQRPIHVSRASRRLVSSCGSGKKRTFPLLFRLTHKLEYGLLRGLEGNRRGLKVVRQVNARNMQKLVQIVRYPASRQSGQLWYYRKDFWHLDHFSTMSGLSRGRIKTLAPERKVSAYWHARGY